MTACPRCSQALRRCRREGFFEETIFASLGYFPWECTGCRRRIRIKQRSKPGEAPLSGRTHSDLPPNSYHQSTYAPGGD
jgi:hypothetical protein